MSAVLIDGKETARVIRAELKEKAAALTAAGMRPGLTVILVGDDPASCSYVTGKKAACEELGIFSDSLHLPADFPEAELLKIIGEKNRDSRIHGILVQLPLPPHIDENKIIEAISPEKDVDGFHPVNVGRMVLEQECFLPCTPHGILQLLMRSGIETKGKKAVVLGRSNIVGKPVANLLFQKQPYGNATVTVCHTATSGLSDEINEADILIAAVGRPGTVTAEMIKPGAVVIDVGVNRIPDASKKSGFRLVGDVDFEAVKEKASYITPVPGGVGPMTITMLMANTILAAERALKNKEKKTC